MSLFDRDPALLGPILDFQQELKRAGFQPPVFCTEQTFPILLAGIPALRTTPGLSGFQDMGKEYFTTIPYCRDTDSVTEAQAHLAQVFHYTDLDSLTAFSRENLNLHQQYQDFESFWEGRPSFALEELSGDAQAVFTACSDFARQFQSIVGRRGFIAWDISENLGHLRAAHACHLISKKEYTELAEYWVAQASAFRSFQEYAVDLLCGAAFWAFRMGCELEEIIDYVNLNVRVLRQLMNSKDAWCGRMWWFKPGTKRLRLSPPELRTLLRDWDGQPGCLASDRITVDGKPVGYCYREEPTPGRPDSGWRFFAGDEDEAYLSEASHTNIYHLNTICNYDPEVLPLLNAPAGSAYGRDELGTFRADT